MKKGWEIKTLGEVSEIMNGGTPDTTVAKFWDGHNLWITPKDMGRMEGIYVDDTLRKITDDGLKNSSAKILPPNSIILSSRAPIGHLAINTKPISTNQGCKGLVPKKGVSTLYLYYFLSKSIDLLNSLGTGATFKELSGSKLGTVEIPLPPFPEQQRIVAILDEAFAAIAKAKVNAEQNLKNAKELFESYLQGVFEKKGEGWEEKTLGEVCEVMNGGTPDTTVSKFWDGEHLWITPKDMGKMKGIYVDNTLRKITDDGLKNSSAKILPPNSIILSSRAPIGHLAINTKPISTNQGCKGLVPKKGVDTLFIYYFLYKSVDLLNSLGTGTTFKELSGSKLTTVIIPIPSLKAQQIIVKKLDALSAETQKLEVIYQNKLNDLEELKKSVLQKAFNGELKIAKALV